LTYTVIYRTNQLNLGLAYDMPSGIDTEPQVYSCTMKPESKLWRKIKNNTPKISWTRLESWSSYGVPDLLGYNDFCAFFMLEMKIARSPKVSFSPHQILFHTTRTKRNFIIIEDASSSCIKLYKSSAIHGLMTDHRETPCLAMDDWEHIQRILIDEPFDA